MKKITVAGKPSNRKFTKRLKQIADLVAEGYSAHAIACKLNLDVGWVYWFLRLMDIRTSAAPHPCGDRADKMDFLPVRDAAARIGRPPKVVQNAGSKGELRVVYRGRKMYTTMEWVHIWLSDSRYRKEARELMQKLVQKHPKSAE